MISATCPSDGRRKPRPAHVATPVRGTSTDPSPSVGTTGIDVEGLVGLRISDQLTDRGRAVGRGAQHHHEDPRQEEETSQRSTDEAAVWDDMYCFMYAVYPRCWEGYDGWNARDLPRFIVCSNLAQASRQPLGIQKENKAKVERTHMPERRSTVLLCDSWSLIPKGPTTRRSSIIVSE